MCGLIIENDELNDICNYLNINRKDFIKKYIKEGNSNYEYTFKHKRCDFLSNDNECLLESVKPKCCIDYPYTDKDDRLFSLHGIVDNTKVCPVIYAIAF